MRNMMRQVRKMSKCVQKYVGRGFAPLELKIVEQAHLDRPCLGQFSDQTTMED